MSLISTIKSKQYTKSRDTHSQVFLSLSTLANFNFLVSGFAVSLKKDENNLFLLPSQDLGLSTVDVLLLLYGRASALTEIGQPEVKRKC